MCIRCIKKKKFIINQFIDAINRSIRCVNVCFGTCIYLTLNGPRFLPVERTLYSTPRANGELGAPKFIVLSPYSRSPGL